VTAALYRVLPPAHWPTVRLNMIASIDGATAVAGVSGGLGGPADQALFAVLRSLVHHRCVGDLGWIADAPAVPPGHRPARLTLMMSTVSSAGPGGYPGRADRRQG